MKTPAEHEETIRAYARADVDTLDGVRPTWASVVEVHTDRVPEDPAEDFELAIAAIGSPNACGVYFAEFDRAAAELAQPIAVPGPAVNMIGEGGRRVPAKVLVDRSMLPSSSSEARAAGTISDAWTLTWIPRVAREHDRYRGQIEQVAAVMEDSVPHADDGTACAVIAYDAIGDALEVQIGLVVAALARDGRRPTAAAIEAAREAAAQLGEHMAAAIGCGLNGSAIRDYAQAFADRLAELHRSGVQ